MVQTYALYFNSAKSSQSILSEQLMDKIGVSGYFGYKMI
jgi:hypothetical protein